MKRAKSSWICWPSAIKEPIRVQRVNHLSRRSFSQRRISYQPPAWEVFGVFWNDGIDSSSLTHGSLSSRKIAFCGANDAGSSSDAIVTSIMSESLLSSKNKCVPQHAAKQRIRFACAILRASPRVMTRSSRGTDPQVT